jgi:molybdopterin converting factor small subunit
MKVRVRLFAVARQLAGADSVEVSLAADATAADLRRALGQQWPALAPLVPHMMVAIGSSYASDAAKIPADADLACIPPVSGG